MCKRVTNHIGLILAAGMPVSLSALGPGGTSIRHRGAALKGGPDGHFSVNSHCGLWCEVEMLDGDPYVRHALMPGGEPVVYRNAEARE